MRRLSALAIAAALGASIFAAAPANAIGVTTCAGAAYVYVGPRGVEIEELYVGSVHDCIHASK